MALLSGTTSASRPSSRTGRSPSTAAFSRTLRTRSGSSFSLTSRRRRLGAATAHAQPPSRRAPPRRSAPRWWSATTTAPCPTSRSRRRRSSHSPAQRRRRSRRRWRARRPSRRSSRRRIRSPRLRRRRRCRETPRPKSSPPPRARSNPPRNPTRRLSKQPCPPFSSGAKAENDRRASMNFGVSYVCLRTTRVVYLFRGQPLPHGRPRLCGRELLRSSPGTTPEPRGRAGERPWAGPAAEQPSPRKRAPLRARARAEPLLRLLKGARQSWPAHAPLPAGKPPWLDESDEAHWQCLLPPSTPVLVGKHHRRRLHSLPRSAAKVRDERDPLRTSPAWEVGLRTKLRPDFALLQVMLAPIQTW
mmetsp:Transcript_19033/g.62029  ORF Transcript_19033/g.62029 Transcript_19033/m.62029 type:complete len:359 (-) Transcript_19033:243-1319(-)